MAKIDAQDRAHPLVAGFPISHFLKHLANDPANSPNARDLAKVAYTGGPKGADGPGAPEALWMLADALDEHQNADGSIGHPKANHYNLRSAADKVHLDQHTYTALREAAEETRRRVARNEHYHPWSFTPESHANRAVASMDKFQGLQPRSDRAILDYVRQRVAQLAPGVEKKHIDESIRRHSLRADHVWRKTNGFEMGVDAEKATRPVDAAKKNEIAARYRRRYARRDLVAWLDPSGNLHPIWNHGTHAAWAQNRGTTPDALHAAGWMRVTPETLRGLWASNPHGPPNHLQRRSLIDAAIEHGMGEVVYDPETVREDDSGGKVLWREEPDRMHRRYALNARGDFIDSLRRVRSRQQQAFRNAAKQVAAKLGLDPTHTLDALHDSPQGATPGVATAVYGAASPEAIQGAAAYLAMINNQTGFGVFHVRPGGVDLLHRFRHQGSGLELRHHLDRAGITNRVLVPHREGFDVLVPDPGGRLRPALAAFTRARGTELQTSPGFFKVVGDADQSRAREMFRGTVGKLSRPRRYNRPESGQLTPDQMEILRQATDQGQMTAIGVLGDHLQENGFEHAGAHLSATANSRPSDWGITTLRHRGDPGDFAYTLADSGDLALHSFRVFGGDGRGYVVWRRERRQGRA